VVILLIVGAMLVSGPSSEPSEEQVSVTEQVEPPAPPVTGNVDDVVDALLGDALEEETAINQQRDDTLFVIGDDQEVDGLSASYDENSI